ncbi:MAG: FxLYD domain-containing protein [Nocardioides sp.]
MKQLVIPAIAMGLTMVLLTVRSVVVRRRARLRAQTARQSAQATRASLRSLDAAPLASAGREASTEAAEGGNNLQPVPAVLGARGAVRDLTLGSFLQATGAVTVTGQVTNSGRHPADYVVILEWLDESSTVVGRGVATVSDLEPGEKRTFAIGALVADSSTRCVPQVLSGRLAAKLVAA